jgi:uncharacterized membrane protein
VSNKSKHKIIIGNSLLIIGSILLIIWVCTFYYYPHRVEGIRTVSLKWLTTLMIPVLMIILGCLNVMSLKKTDGMGWKVGSIFTYIFRRGKNDKSKDT